jgi:hypothetical protein
MERNAKIGIGLVVLGALGVGLYFQIKKDQSLGTVSTTADLPELKVGDDVDKIDITNGSKGEVVLEKKGDKWELSKPVVAPANEQFVKTMVDAFKELKLVDRAAPKADDELKKTYELGPDKAVHVIAFKGPDKKLDATFGKSGGLGDAMMLDGKPEIFLVKGYSSWTFAKEAKEWRNREILKIDDANATSFEIDNKSGNFVFTKASGADGGNAWTGTFKKKPIEHFDASKVPTALGAFKNLMADDFADGKTAAETGVDAPEATVTIKMKDGATYAIKIGKAADKAHYAQKNDEMPIFTMGAFPYEWATGELSKFQQPADAGAPDSGKPAAGGPGGLKLPPGHPGGGMPPGHPGGPPPGHP